MSGGITGCLCRATGRGPGLRSHIERSDQTICEMTGGIMGDINMAVVGLVLTADSGAGCASRKAIFPWCSLLGYLAAVNVHR